jgi:hypothetical protein
VNRFAADPVQIVLLTDLPMPFMVEEIVPWNEMRPNRFQRAFMLSDGIMPTSASELARIYGSRGAFEELWPSADAVKKDREAHGNKGVETLFRSLIGLRPPYRAEYRRAG